MKIVRLWRGRASPANADAYRAHLASDVFPKLAAIDGFEGAELLERREGPDVQVLVLTRWASIEAVRAFAGTDLEMAVVEPDARAVLSAFDDRVAHYQVALAARDETEARR